MHIGTLLPRSNGICARVRIIVYSLTVVLSSRSAAGLLGIAVLLSSLTACANSPSAKEIEQRLAADPQLKTKPVTFGESATPTPETSDARITPPADFPSEIPLYPNARLLEVTQPTNQDYSAGNNSPQVNQPQRLIWVTSDPSNLVQNFYKQKFQANNWDLEQSEPDATTQGDTLKARLNDLLVTVSIIPSSSTNTDTSVTPAPNQPDRVANPQSVTRFIIQYERNATQTAQNPTESQATTPQSGDRYTAPTRSPTPDNQRQNPNDSQSFIDLNRTPQELQQQITDLAALGVLPLEPNGSKSNHDAIAQFNPSKTITRREFARWLVAANNQIHVNRPSQQIREAASTAQPAFSDITSTDPDFAQIQGLAEAGIISSRLSGDATAVLFRPDAPLTREQLILWKVPLDIRQALPNPSIDAVRESWGFQDVAKIDPKVLRAVLADFQIGDRSNIRRVFGYTTLFQPKKPVTRAEAAASLWFFGNASEGISAREALQLKQQQSQPQSQPSTTPESVPSTPN